MKKAKARHILVKSIKLCKKLKKEIESKEISFERAAKRYSKCPSSRNNGELGEFSKGDMVAEFDRVVFTEDLNVLHGPIKTQFGFHLIEITSRK